MNPFRISTIIVGFSFFCLISNAQNYHATNGSAYAGSVGILNNPAASVNSLYKWDLNLFSIQTTFTTNNILISKDTSKLNYLTGATKVNFKSGSNSYYAHQNLDINLFNFMFKFDEKHAFGIGLRGRMYNHFKTSPIFMSDTLSSGYSFFRMNRSTPFLDGFMTHAGWIEMNLNYSQVLQETERSRLTAGITLNISKAISGFHGRIGHMTFNEFIVNNQQDTGYIITQGSLNYLFNKNLDPQAPGTSQSLNQFLNNSQTGLGISLGMEWLIYDRVATDGNPHTPTNYNWKLGFSVMDLGKNTYQTSKFSGIFYTPIAQLNDGLLDVKTSNFSTINAIKDSLASLFSAADSLPANFYINKPTRIILNADKNLGNHFALNTQVNINFYSTSSYKKINTRELNLITITPRWETIAWGIYAPIQFTTQGKLWMGAALKLGPLLIGVHNIAIKKSINTINGGGYLMLSMHPFNKKKIMSRLDCPEE